MLTPAFRFPAVPNPVNPRKRARDLERESYGNGGSLEQEEEQEQHAERNRNRSNSIDASQNPLLDDLALRVRREMTVRQEWWNLDEDQREEIVRRCTLKLAENSPDIRRILDIDVRRLANEYVDFFFAKWKR